MENTELMNKPQKSSLVKSAVWSAILDFFIILIHLYLLLKPNLTFIPDNYLSNAIISIGICFIFIILMIVVLILAISQTWNTEKQDELSKLHKYKAGYISRYICIICIIVAICIIKDFRFAFTDDYFDNMRIPFVIFFFAQLVENIIFIILEKFNLE